MGTAERICSRKNGYITVLRKLGADAAYRRETGETVLDGEKLLREAAAAGCEITGLLMDEARPLAEIPECGRLYVAPAELVGYASPVKNSPGPVFSLKLPELARARQQAEAMQALHCLPLHEIPAGRRGEVALCAWSQLPPMKNHYCLSSDHSVVPAQSCLSPAEIGDSNRLV